MLRKFNFSKYESFHLFYNEFTIKKIEKMNNDIEGFEEDYKKLVERMITELRYSQIEELSEKYNLTLITAFLLPSLTITTLSCPFKTPSPSGGSSQSGITQYFLPTIFIP